MINTPIITVSFNRPDKTLRLVEALRAVKPRHIIAVCDAPRRTHPEDAELCASVKKIISEGIDWDCRLEEDYSADNMGCGRRIYAGITKAFERVPQAIILEDDCIPDPSFFRFCEEMLDRYERDSRIMHIAGSNRIKRPEIFRDSYIFTHTPLIWGWATWARAWKGFDREIPFWKAMSKEQKEQFLRPYSFDAQETAYRILDYDRSACQKVNTWGHQWVLHVLKNAGLAIVPKSNLISNEGFDERATHTKNKPLGLPKRAALEFPLRHPSGVECNRDFDRAFGQANNRHPTIFHRVLFKLRRMTKRSPS
jgi:hypothetical protein